MREHPTRTGITKIVQANFLFLSKVNHKNKIVHDIKENAECPEGKLKTVSPLLPAFKYH